MENIKTLRKKCKRLLFDLEGAGKIGSQPKRMLARNAGVSYGVMVMALSGYRSSKGACAVLQKLHEHLTALKNN